MGGDGEGSRQELARPSTGLQEKLKMPSLLGSFEVLRQLLLPKIKCLRPFSVRWRAEGGGSFNAKLSEEVL